MDVRGKSAFEASSLLQGPSETFVTIEVVILSCSGFLLFSLMMVWYAYCENCENQVKHGNCGPIQSMQVQRQLVARTPVFYRLEHLDNGTTSVGYMRLKEFNALARKDLVTGNMSYNFG